MQERERLVGCLIRCQALVLLCWTGFVAQRKLERKEALNHRVVASLTAGSVAHIRTFKQKPRDMLSTMRIDVSVPVADDTNAVSTPTPPLRTTAAAPQVAAKHKT